MTEPDNWSFHNPVEIFFGAGALERLPNIVTARKLLLVTTPGFTRRGVAARIQSLFPGRSITVFDQIAPNPDLATLDSAVSKLSRLGTEQIMALGGGSVMDAAKAFSVLLAPGATRFTLENHFHRGVALPQTPFLPVVAIPTTAGTGSEVTPFATVWDMAAYKKHSLASPALFPQIALLDPALTLDLPWKITMATGMDALSQALESTWNRNATHITLGMAEKAGKLVLQTLPKLANNLSDLSLRSGLMAASLLSGLCISQTRTALAHSMSYPITARLGVPHGLACGFTLPEVLEFNLPADDGRLEDLAQGLIGDSATGLQKHLEKLLNQLGVDRAVRHHFSGFESLEPHLHEMLTPNRADNNLRTADRHSVTEILRKSCARCFVT